MRCWLGLHLWTGTAVYRGFRGEELVEVHVVYCERCIARGSETVFKL